MIANVRRVEAKLGGMRKPQDFIVYPVKEGEETLIVQSDKSIGQFDRKTGKGILNTKGCYFHHLNSFMGAKEFQFPEDFVAACETAIPKSNPNGAISIFG